MYALLCPWNLDLRTLDSRAASPLFHVKPFSIHLPLLAAVRFLICLARQIDPGEAADKHHHWLVGVVAYRWLDGRVVAAERT
jgi:hypothetical protein